MADFSHFLPTKRTIWEIGNILTAQWDGFSNSVKSVEVAIRSAFIADQHLL